MERGEAEAINFPPGSPYVSHEGQPESWATEGESKVESTGIPHSVEEQLEGEEE